MYNHQSSLFKVWYTPVHIEGYHRTLLAQNNTAEVQGTTWKAILHFSSVHSFSRVPLFVTPWTEACQDSLSITNSWSLIKFMCIESVMPSNHFILCQPLLLPPSILSTIKVFSNESALHIRWTKYWSFNFSISPSNEHSGLISFRMTGWTSLQSKGLSRVFFNTTVQKHQFFGTQPLLLQEAVSPFRGHTSYFGKW